MVVDPISFLAEVFQEAKRRVPGNQPTIEFSVTETIERLEAEKRKEWAERGIPAGLIERALNWTRQTAEGWASRFPEEKREERIAELYPSLLMDAERRYIRGIMKAMYEPTWKT